MDPYKNLHQKNSGAPSFLYYINYTYPQVGLVYYFCYGSRIVLKYEFLAEPNGYTPMIDTYNNAILFDGL